MKVINKIGSRSLACMGVLTLALCEIINKQSFISIGLIILVIAIIKDIREG